MGAGEQLMGDAPPRGRQAGRLAGVQALHTWDTNCLHCKCWHSGGLSKEPEPWLMLMDGCSAFSTTAETKEKNLKEQPTM